MRSQLRELVRPPGVTAVARRLMKSNRKKLTIVQKADAEDRIRHPNSAIRLGRIHGRGRDLDLEFN